MDSYQPRPTTVEAMRHFVRSVDGAVEVLDVHQTDNFGTTLPHVLMAELTRWFVAAVTAGSDEIVRSFLAAVENLYLSDDPDVRNVVQVSFMEYLTVAPDLDEQAAIAAAHRWAGPKITTDLADQKHRRTRPAGR